MTRAQRELKGVEAKIEEFGLAAQEILGKSDTEDRDPTPAEQDEVNEHLKAINGLKERKTDLESQIEVEGQAREFGRKLGTDDEKPEQPQGLKSIGDQFVESEKYTQRKSAGFSGKWSTGQIDLKATLLEGDNTYLTGGTPGAGAPLIPIDRRPGVLPILFERLTVANLLASGVTNSNAINYVVETVADPGSTGIVEEGQDKPEAELEFDEVQTAVKKIATFLPVSDEMLEDAEQIRSYINARLSLFIQNEEENQLLNGAGGGDIDGLLNNVPVANQGVVSSAQAANDADHIYAALTEVRVGSFLEPDGVVVHPTDWAAIRLLKDQNDSYLGGSPFSNDRGEPTETLFGKRVVVTQAITEGTSLVGAFGTAAQVFRRGGLTVEASNSHADYFRKNLTAIRAEERLALAVYRPEAFATADISGS